MITLVLGRDGMGDPSEEDFDKWVDFVCTHIDDRCGFEVGVDVRHPHDVQSDTITGGTDAERQTVSEAKEWLWD